MIKELIISKLPIISAKLAEMGLKDKPLGNFPNVLVLALVAFAEEKDKINF